MNKNEFGLFGFAVKWIVILQVILFVGGLLLLGVGCVVGYHFIAKFW